MTMFMSAVLFGNMAQAQHCGGCKTRCGAQQHATCDSRTGVCTIQSVTPGVAKDGTVTIGAIPATEAEFDALQAQLGTSPEGCIALQLVAMQMFQNDPKLGAVCLRKNNTDTNYSSVESRLKELFRANDSYARLHLVATFMKGATVGNGFNPTFPYAIKVRKAPNKPDQKSQLLKGYVKYYEVYSEGYDTHWRGIEVVQQKGDTYYKVSNCPALCTQCKEVDWEASQDYQGLKTTME